MTSTSDLMFRVIDNSAVTPAIVHAPHGGRMIPAAFLADFLISPAELESENPRDLESAGRKLSVADAAL